MAQYEFIGTIKKVGDVQSFPSGFSKRELVVSSEGERFPQDVMFEFLKEKGDLLNSLNEADRVKVSFDIGGREYNGKYFNSLKGWKIEKVDGSTSVAAPAAQGIPPRAEMPKDIAVDDDDNLPF